MPSRVSPWLSPGRGAEDLPCLEAWRDGWRDGGMDGGMVTTATTSWHMGSLPFSPETSDPEKCRQITPSRENKISIVRLRPQITGVQ